MRVGGVLDAHRVGGGLRLLHRLRDRHGDVLTVVTHHVVLERRPLLVDQAAEALRRPASEEGSDVASVVDRAHAEHLPGDAVVDGDDAAARNRAAYGHRVQHAGKRDIGRISRASADLERSVDAGQLATEHFGRAGRA